MPPLYRRFFLCGLCLLLLPWSGACGSNQSRDAAGAEAAPGARSYGQALLRTGLVAGRHRRWLLFADTTRREYFRLGRTPREVRAWLADYEERIEDHQTLNPDSVQPPPPAAAELRGPPPPPMVTLIRLPNSPAAKALARRQAIQLMQQLQRAGLLTAAEYRRTLPLAMAGEFYSRRNLLTTFNELARAAESLRHSRGLPPMLQQLGLLSKPETERLACDLRTGLFTDPVDLLARLPHARIFSRRQYPAAGLPYLEQLHRDAARLVPGLQFSNFRARVIRRDEAASCPSCMGAEDVLVQLQIGSRQYAQRSEWHPGYGLDGRNWPTIDDSKFYGIFNQALADQGSPYRLMFIRSAQARFTIGGQQRFGLWCLTAPQAEAIDTLEFSGLWPEDHESFRVLPSDTVTAALRAFAALGFLSHRSPAQRTTAEACLRQVRLIAREEVLHSVPGRVAEYHGYPQYRSWSYARLLNVLQKASNGRFGPNQVRDGCQHADGTLRFHFGRRIYQSALYQANESPDPRLFQLVQRALREQHIPGKFYQVSATLAQSAGLAVNYVFLSPVQERAIRQKHLLALTDPTLSDDQRYAQELAIDMAADSTFYGASSR
ncbi:hypothetical protein [Hymenobacter convexus]|uniref:hypothetical protein n=1 Tax=Hymenobacter sp. CA1UV-4 TaxID=3063782 RepID=UPI0027122707|nr:hypothetical protein [Hymenobacter sp. CA1UV-4]MDO7852612.1 hypothetical protein [Hymenobacter sp. CA1UV-4]